MRINPYNLQSNLIQNNYYINKLKYLDVSKNSSIYLIPKLNILVKIYKITDKEYNKNLTTANVFNLKLQEYNKIGHCNPYRELDALLKLTNLYYTDICPHTCILITYKHFENKCKHCNKLISNNLNNLNKVSNSIINYLNLKLISNHELFIYKEYIEYEFKYFWKNKLTEEFMNVFLFQMLYTLYINNTVLELINYDLHLHNIFVKKIKPGGHWVYTIKDVKYYIPNIGFIFIIGDYSNCLSLQFKLTKDELQKYKWFKSIHYDVYSLLQNFTYYNRKKYYIHWNHRNTFVNKIKNNYPNIYNKILNKIHIIISKNKDKKYSINKFLYTELLDSFSFEKEKFHILFPDYVNYKLNSNIKKLIHKYINNNININKLPSYPELNPLTLITNEFKLFRVKPSNLKILKEYKI